MLVKSIGSLVGMSVICLFLGVGCAKYKPHPMQSVMGHGQELRGVSVVSQALSDSDCHYYFSRHVGHKGYRAIQLSIRNNSAETYVLDARDISLSIQNSRAVAHDLHLNTAGRMLGWGIPGLFLWPFLVTSLVEGMWSSEANTRLDRDFNKRVLSNDSCVVVHPNSVVSKVLFVKGDEIPQTFTLGLLNKNSDEKISFNL